jgi:hypothetical protein
MLIRLSVFLALSYTLQTSDAFSTRQIAVTSLLRDSLNRRQESLILKTKENQEQEEEFAEGFGVGEKAIGLRDLIQNEEDILEQPLSKKNESTVLSEPTATKSSPTLRPKAVMKFIAPTFALWIAPPIMSLIDTSVVGRYCGPTDLAGMYKPFDFLLQLSMLPLKHHLTFGNPFNSYPFQKP